MRKATFYKEIYLTLLCEKHIRDAFYLIEKSKFIFDGNFLGTQTEKDVDALLCFFDMICRLYFSKNLTKQEMHDFKYEFTMVYCNKEIQRYLDYIKDIYNQRQIQGMPFSSFLSYCKNYMLPHVDILKNEHSNPNKSVILDHDET